MKKPTRKIVTLEVETTLTNKDLRTAKFWNDQILGAYDYDELSVKQVQVNAIKTPKDDVSVDSLREYPKNKFNWVKEY